MRAGSLARVTSTRNGRPRAGRLVATRPALDSTAFTRLLDHLRATNFGELAGTRVHATIPIAESLLNAFIRDTMPPNLPVREVSVTPEDGNRLSVRVVPKAMFMPALTVKLDIEKQAEIPTAPVLVLRLATMPGLLGLAGAALPQVLPPGIRMQGEVILVDLLAMARHHGFEQVFGHLRQVRVTTERGRLVIGLDAGVG
jgi:hypothetical protein